MKRWSNYGMWTALAALVGMALIDLGVLKDLSRFNEYVEKGLYILILAGIVSNPESGKWFGNSKDEEK